MTDPPTHSVPRRRTPTPAEPIPVAIEPMLATAGRLPSDMSGWALELKWDGVRAITCVGAAAVAAGLAETSDEGGAVHSGSGTDGRARTGGGTRTGGSPVPPVPRASAGGVRVTGRRGVPVHDRYPELAVLGEMLAGHDAVLDGEVVAFEEARPSFERLQRRMHVSGPAPRLMREVPVQYMVFDLLYLDGRSLLDTPYRHRRELLDGLGLTAGPIETPPSLPGPDADQVSALLEFTRRRRLEGLIAKRLDSPYRPGRRVDFWIKAKNFHTQEVVVVGWKPGKGRREGGAGSLLLGVHDRPGGRLLFAGHVGTGFTDRALDEITALLAPLARTGSPLAEPVPREFSRYARWAEPRLVGEVTHGGWTQEGRLRAPSWRGLRDDRDPMEVIREP